MATASFSKKVTFSLPANLLDRAKSLAAKGHAPSLSGLVQNALEKHLTNLEQAELRQAMQAAATDPLFLEDIRAVERDFAFSDAEWLKWLWPCSGAFSGPT